MKHSQKLLLTLMALVLASWPPMSGRQLNRQGVEPLSLPAKSKMKSPASLPVVELIGSVLNDDGRIGLYSFSSDGTGGFVRQTSGPYVTHGGVLHDGKYFYGMYAPFMGMNISRSVLLDVADNWRTIREINDDMSQKLMATAMANDPVTNHVYGCFHSSNGRSYEFGVVDVDNFTRTTITTLAIPWEAAGFTADGTLYVVLHTGELATVDLATGANTVIGDTGLTIGETTSGTIDHRTDTFYFATYASADKALYVIDLATATPTKLFDMPGGEQIGGMFINYPTNAAQAPAEVTEAAALFEGSALEGAITFRAPTETFSGAPLSGDLTYEVKLSGASIASGNCQPGAMVSAPVSVNSRGHYQFEITVANSDGTSVPVKIGRYVGADNPARPANVVFVADGFDFTLTWDAVTTSANGGYVDFDNLTYTVTRYPGAVQTTGITGTTFSETVPAPDNVTSFYYTVTAHAGSQASEPAESNVVVSGFITPPYSEDFSSPASMEPFTIIDANKDGKTWSRYAAGSLSEARSMFHSSNKSDDWLITAPIRLEAGKVYDLTYDVKAYNRSYKERYEVCMGTAATVDAMTRVLVEPTVLSSATYERIAVAITVEETGNYYIGFHAISDANMYYVCLDNISLVAPTTPDTPGVVTDFLVTPDYNGATQGLVSFKAPVQSINGNDLTSLTKITVKRNDAVVHTFGECAPGAELSFTDRASEIGQYSYEIVAYNEYGAGTTFTAAARLGVNLMPAAKNAAITETSPGKVRLTWDAPTEDIAGFPISPDVAHYAILDKTGLGVLAEDLAATQFDIDVVAADGTQTFVFYYIMTQTAAGLNNDDYVYTPQIPVGPAYSYPFYESFAGGRLSNAWAITRGDSGTATWGVGPSSQQPVASPQDGDGGLAGFQPYAAGEEANLHSGKIAIPGDAVAPCLSFYYYAVAGATDELDAMISVDHGEFETLKTVVLNETGQTGWTRVIVPLDAYKGRTVEIGFNGRCVTHNYLILIDNISVADVLANNLAVDGLYAPASMVAGAQGTVRATVHNRGIAAAEGAKAALVCDGERVDTQEIGLLQAGAKTDVVFAMVPSVFAEGATDCHVEILWDADMLKSDNKTEVLPVRIVAPTLPPVTDLSARVEGGNLVLEWGEPDLSAQIARTVREDFEECESFAVNRAGDWTFIDGDQAATYGIEDVEFPHNGEPMAYIVFDNTAAGLDTSFAMASGNKCLVSISNASGVSPNDDWAISPRLDGSAQTVSFDVRSYTDRYGYDSYEVLYSTTGSDRDSFVKLAENKTVPTTWTTYSYQLPAGAVYFAIRCTSADTFMFMVDNVEYISATAPSVPELKGFNVYRDRQPLVSCQAGHAYAEPYNDKAVYHVTAVYATGESVPSNEVSGNSSINLTDSGDALTAVGKSGEIEVRHAAGALVDIYAANGACVYSASDSDTHRVAVAPGVYLVRGAGLTIKVVVR